MKKESLFPNIFYVFLLLLVTSCAGTPTDIWSLLRQGDDRARDYFLGDVDVDARDPQGRTPLHYAAERRNAQLAEFFILRGADVNALDNSGQSALGISIENNDTAVTQIIAAGGADIHMKIKNDTTAAALALNTGSIIFKAVLTRANLESTDGNGKNVLHMASIAGNIQAVSGIISLSQSSTIYINKKDNSDKNALDYALERPDSKLHMEVAQELILSGGFSDNSIFNYFAPAVRSGNYNIRRNEGLAPIHHAVIDDHVGLILFLLEKEEIDVNIKSTSGATALHEAVRNGNIEVITMLLENGADVNARDAKNNTALHTGIPSEVHREVVTLLLEWGANPTLRDEHGDTPLHVAIILNRSVDVIQAILNGGVDLVHIRNIQGKTPLYIAVQEGRAQLIPVLISYGSEVFAADNSGITPFTIAARSNTGIFNLLITEDTVNQRDSEGNTILHAAVIDRVNPEQIGRILDQRAPVDARNRDGDTALHIAVRMNQRESGEFLILRGASIFSLNGAGHSPLFFALTSNPVREWIINPKTIENSDGLGNTMLHYAAEWNLDNVIPVIIRNGMSVETVNATGQTPIFMAVKNDSSSTMRTFAENNANLNARDSQGNSVLHTAVRWNAINSSVFLISSGIDINAHSLNGNTSLHEAVIYRASSIETLLINSGANLEARNNDGNTALMEAARAAQTSSVEKLAQNGADPSTRNTRGDTPLHIAVTIENFELVNSLLRNGASIHARNTRNVTPFQLSIGISPQMVSALLSDNRINITDDTGNSALHVAVQEGASAEIVRRIITQGARINAIDSNGRTPLRVSVDLNAWNIAKIISDAGADPFIAAADNKTPAEIAFSKGDDCIRAIFSGRAINARDSSGNTVLHIGARYGNPESIATLFELGANRTIRNIASESAFDIAVRWNRRENADLLRAP